MGKQEAPAKFEWQALLVVRMCLFAALFDHVSGNDLSAERGVIVAEP